jgi:hypothetical protein
MRFCALAFSAIFCFCVREYLREETVAANELAQKRSANRDTIIAFTAQRNPVMNKTRPKYENCTARLQTAQLPAPPEKPRGLPCTTQTKNESTSYEHKLKPDVGLNMEMRCVCDDAARQHPLCIGSTEWE